MSTHKRKSNLKNQSGFIIADFLFSFTLIISCGIVIFGMTFSLASVEISQYIVWSTARNFSAANISETVAQQQARVKFANLSKQFSLITGASTSGVTPWFVLNNLLVGNLAGPSGADGDLRAKLAGDSDNKDNGGSGERRQPWIGAKADLELKLLSGFNVPFLGPVAPDKTIFKFPIRAFVLRHPSQEECFGFFTKEKRFNLGIQKLETQMESIGDANKYVPIEDNGC